MAAVSLAFHLLFNLNISYMFLLFLLRYVVAPKVPFLRMVPILIRHSGFSMGGME
jgi:hypothetical protein